MAKFKDKLVMITGASSGIGAALACLFAKEGAHLVLTARRLERLEKLAKEIEELGQKALPIQCDVSKDGELEKAVEIVHEKLGTIDIVVANAGFGIAGSFDSLKLADYRRQFETNVFGALRTIYATLEDIKKSKGTIAIVASVNGYISLPKGSPYGMSKHALRSFATSLYHEMKPLGISVVLISPGFVASEIRKRNFKGELKEEAKDPIPSWLVMPTEKAAAKILQAIYKKKREAIITFHGKVIVFFASHFPRLTNFLIQKFSVGGQRYGKN